MVGGGDKCNCKGPYKWEAAELESEREGVIMEAEVRGKRLEDATLWPRRWRKRPQAKGCETFLEAGTGMEGNGFSPGASRRNQPC